jgi:DNA-binding phage protein
MVKTRSYKEHLLKQLQKPEEAAIYLNAALHDDDPHVFLLALRDIAEAKGGMGIISISSDKEKIQIGQRFW